MKLSNRLMACASMVRPGSPAADIGTDHGYLPVYLLTHGICPSVIAADVREMPLEAAKRSARRAGITEGISFCLSDGLANVPVKDIRTVICAGMGGDCILGILERAREVWTPEYQFILQPQSSVSDLRKWLGENGFLILREKLAQDGKFIYTVLEVRFGGGMAESPGRHFLSEVLVKSGEPLLPAYYRRVKNSLIQTTEGMKNAKAAVDVDLMRYYETALREVVEMGERYGLGE